MSTPLVSILIPCHNAGLWLHATLESAFAQTWPHREVILVDDGSTDNSVAIASEFETRGLRFFAQANAGASAARNHALRLATGDFIQYLDADDLLHPDKISRQLAGLTSSPAGTVGTGKWGRFTADPALTLFPENNPLFADLSPRDYLRRYASQDCMMHPAAWLIPRNVVQQAGPWDEKLSLNDDGEYFARIVRASRLVRWCGDAVSYYRSGLSGSLSAQRSRRHLESAHLAMTQITTTMRRLDNSLVMRRAAADLCQRFAYDYYPAAPDLIAAAERRADEFGGSTLRPLGGRGFQLASRLVGWKIARRCQIQLGRFAAPSSG